MVCALTSTVDHTASTVIVHRRFRINSVSGDSLKDVDKAMFTIYGEDDDDESSESEEQRDAVAVEQPVGGSKAVLYSCDVGMGFDCGAILLGVLYRTPGAPQEWTWTVVEEKNAFDQLIANNLCLFYDELVIAQRPNDCNVKSQLTKCGERYIMVL